MSCLERVGHDLNLGSQWSNANLVPNIANGASSDDLAPSLWANTDGAPLTNGTTIKYTLAANPGGTSPLSNTLDRFFTRAATLFQ